MAKTLQQTKASALFDQIKNSGDRSSCQEVHPVVAETKACRRMNLLTAEVENSSRYEFLILTKNWNIKNVLVFLFEVLFLLSWHVSAAVMFASRPLAIRCVSLFRRRTSLTHVTSQCVLCGESGSHETTSPKHTRRQHHRSTAGHMTCRSRFFLKGPRYAGISHRRFEETCVASTCCHLSSQRACDRQSAEGK